MSAGARLDYLAEALGLNDAQLADLLRTGRLELARWRIDGIPGDRAREVDDLVELARRLGARLAPQTVVHTLRAPVPGRSGWCALDAIAAGHHQLVIDMHGAIDRVERDCLNPDAPAPSSAVEPPNWPPPVTGGLGRPGFRYEDVPDIFGQRRGCGPLIVNPDANILIAMHENLDAVEAHLGTLGGPYMAPPWASVAEALRDVLAVWWWRDLRIRVDETVAMTDNRPDRPLTPARAAARSRTVAAWNEDFWSRGGFDVIREDQDGRVEPLPALDDKPQTPPRWPRGELDRRVVESALHSGCHVLLTEDRDVLRCHATMRKHGLAVLRPAELLTLLDEAGQLEPVRTAHDPMPDLQALASFYRLRSPEDALREADDPGAA